MVQTGESASKQFGSLKKHPGAIWGLGLLSLTETRKNLGVTNVVDGRFVVVVDMVHPQGKEITMTTEGKMREVFVQMWEESERGWGCRPDGFSLHLNQEDLDKYVKAYWDRMPANAPDVYGCPDGEPFKALVSEECYQQLTEASPVEFGLRYWNSDKRLFAKIS